MSLPTDHTKISNKLKFNYHQDAGHGWLAVKIDLIRELNISDKITSYSYMKNEYAYLEEDQDAGTFSKAFEAKFKHKPIINTLRQRSYRSVIRNFRQFKIEV